MLIRGIAFTTHLHMVSHKHCVCTPVPQFSQRHCGSLQNIGYHLEINGHQENVLVYCPPALIN